MNRGVSNQLKRVSKLLPLQRYEFRQSYQVDKEGIELSGLTVPDGMNIEEGVNYTFNSTGTHQVNHYRRLKRAYLSNGSEGVFKYLESFVSPENINQLNQWCLSLR